MLYDNEFYFISLPNSKYYLYLETLSKGLNKDDEIIKTNLKILSHFILLSLKMWIIFVDQKNLAAMFVEFFLFFLVNVTLFVKWKKHKMILINVISWTNYLFHVFHKKSFI